MPDWNLRGGAGQPVTQSCIRPVCLIGVVLRFADGSQRTVNLRWLYEDADGQPIASSLPGVWRLRNWGPMAFMSTTA